MTFVRYKSRKTTGTRRYKIPLRPLTTAEQKRLEEHLPLIQWIVGKMWEHDYVRFSYQNLHACTSEAVVAFIRAMFGFNPAYKVAFSSYVVEAMRHEIIRGARTGGAIHIPPHLGSVICQEDEGRTPSHQISRHVRERALQAFNVLSLSWSVNSDRDESLDQNVADPKCPDPYTLIENREDLDRVWQMIGTLPKRYQKILTLRYGLTGGAPLTLREIAEKLSLSKERVRQIEGKATRILQIRFADRNFNYGSV